MENNYWIVNEWLIFKPDFNDELDKYYNVINKYQKIDLSNNIHLTHLTFWR